MHRTVNALCMFGSIATGRVCTDRYYSSTVAFGVVHKEHPFYVARREKVKLNKASFSGQAPLLIIQHTCVPEWTEQDKGHLIHRRASEQGRSPSYFEI